MLNELGRHHGTDKCDAGHTFGGLTYLDVYERYLGPLRLTPVTVLELGVRDGASLRMWRDYFPAGEIHGVDLNPDSRAAADERITVHTMSQDDAEGLADLAASVGGFDLVVDDASHINALTLASHHILWPHVRMDGYYVIEDLGMSRVDYATLTDQDTFMGGELKANIDRGTSPHQTRETMTAFFEDITRGLDARRGTVRFLHFWSNMAVIQRGAPEPPG